MEDLNPRKKRRIIGNETNSLRTSLPMNLPTQSTSTAASILGEEQALVDVDRLNILLKDIIEGQEDITVPAGVAETRTTAIASGLYTQLLQIIEDKNRLLNAKQQRLVDAENEAMAQEQAIQLIEENTEMINELNDAMAISNERLSRANRIELNRRILQLVNASVTNMEVNEQLQRETEGIKNNIKGLFNALIQYYTEMATYGYERSPEILTQCGSIIAGTAIIGGTIIVAPGATGGGGSLLLTLASYLNTATTTATGLYFLQKGGLPIRQMLENVGGNTVQCLQTGCQQIRSQLGKLCKFGLDTAGEYLTGEYQDLKIDYDEMSGNFSIRSMGSIAPSVSSIISTANSVKTAIEAILDVPVEEQITEILEEVSPPMVEVNIEENQPMSQLSDIDGGKRRKSRRHIKMKSTRKGRKGRKNRITKKGKKHHKTLKRYRSKTRR